MDTLTLPGELVSLIPLEMGHAQALVNAARDGKLWELWYTSVPSEETITEYIQTALDQRSAGQVVPFSVLHNGRNEIIGSTRYCNLDQKNRRLEIGYTWYSEYYQRTAVNTESKLLLLRFAFEELNCIAVEFRTHWHNFNSRKAILKLGAKQDGVLRNHRIDADGVLRDTVVFSIIASEWPVVKKALTHRLEKYQRS